MKLVFVSNFLNHHQQLLCDSFMKIFDPFYFIATDSHGTQGYQTNTEASYVIHYDDEHYKELAIKEIIDADVVIFGSCPNILLDMRLAHNKLSFLYTERFLKKGLWRSVIPSVHRKIYNRLLKHKGKELYVLAAGDKIEEEFKLLKYPICKCFKWGYFPYVENILPDDLEANKKKGSMIWCGRMLKWKHPEYAIYLAKKLKRKGMDFSLSIVGDGPLYNKIEKRINKYKLHNNVTLLRGMPNTELRKLMKESQIFIFTSDMYEGWGAVLNEAMNAGCYCVVNDCIGAAGFLIQNFENGVINHKKYKKNLLSNVEMILSGGVNKLIPLNAYNTIINRWNPEKAAANFLILCNNILLGSDKRISDDEPGAALGV